MAEIIDMPKLSDTMSVGTIVNWLKKEGDAVAVGDILCEVETDKATMELENLVADGVLLKIYVAKGGETPVGSPICAIGEKGEAAPEVGGAAAPAAQEAAPAKADKPTETASTEAPQPQGRKQESLTPAPAPAAPAAAEGGRIKASPLARKLAEEKGVSLAAVTGTGPAGRIMKEDVLKAAANGGAQPAAATETAAPAAPAAPMLEDKVIPVTNMRKTIARRLLESKTQLPHFYVETEIDAAALLKLRKELNDSLAGLAPEQGGIKFTANDFILKASAEALRRVPGVNTSWYDDGIKQHGSVHLAFGVAVEEGLLTPVIRDAHAKSLRQISAEAKALIKKARAKKLSPAEMSGSTFTVTNLGMYGVTGFFGIINPPNSAILSVGATIKKPVVDKNDNIVVGHRMAIGFSGDHRVIDGATGAEFLMALKAVLETPSLMLV